MPVNITDLFSAADLAAAVEAAHVRQVDHAEVPYRLLNYTEAAQWDSAWTPVTLACRGLIYDAQRGDVVARPFGKFFNYGQPGAAEIVGPVEVTDKLDGSLGILYWLPDGTAAVATRGSFTSDQAVHATGVYLDRYDGRWSPEPDITYLFEIIYPENRIVCDYGATDDLFLLARVETATGRSLPMAEANDDWPGPTAEVFPYASLPDALAAEPRPGAEGFVVHGLDSGQRVKIKQEDYVRLHRIITGVSTVNLWRAATIGDLVGRGYTAKQAAAAASCSVGEAEGIGDGWLDAVLEDVPDEFYGWAKNVLTDLSREVEERHAYWRALYTAMNLDRFADRKTQAATILADDQAKACSGVMFSLLDGRDVWGTAWKLARPDYSRPFKAVSEDVA